MAANRSALVDWTPAGDCVYRRCLSFEDSLPETVDLQPILARPSRKAPREGSWPSGDVPTDRLVFFDLETTGLSGGTGTVAFLASLGRKEGRSFSVEQVFMDDFPGEPAFLEILDAGISEDDILVTHNGSCFDIPLLRSRFVMNRMAYRERRHADFLFTARRLWRTVAGSASLEVLEATVLGLERGLDVPGELIPGIWLDFVKAGIDRGLPAVFEHNAADVRGLMLLLRLSLAVFDSPLEEREPAPDPRGLASILVSIGRVEEGEELLRRAFRRGDSACGMILARRLARRGAKEERASIIRSLPEDRLDCLIAKAVFAEHGERNAERALSLARAARAILEARGGEDKRLAGRIERLLGKVSLTSRP